MSIEFIWPIRVYYEDTDAGGVVFYANYLKYIERARTEWLNHLGIDQVSLLSEGIAFMVKNVAIDYKMPAKLNDQLQVVSRISELSGASLTFQQSIYLKDKTEKQNLLCEATVKVLSLKLKSFTPCRIPANVKKELQSAC